MDLYQDCSNYAPEVKNATPIDLYRKKNFIFLSENKRHRAFIINYVASSSGPLQILFKLCPWGQY